MLVMDNRTGERLVWIGSKDFWDDESSGKIDGCIIKRQPGSTLKPLLYAEAFRRGFNPASILPDIPPSFKEGRKLYAPRNYSNNFSGSVRARIALASSLYVPAVYLLSKIGNNIFYSTLLSAGFKSLNKGEKFYGLGLVLGSGEVTLKELVRVYSIFANNGFLIPERKVIYYKTNEGKLLSPHEGIKRKVFDEKISFLINSILSDNYSRGLGFSENSPLKFPYQIAVKQEHQKVLEIIFVLYTPEIGQLEYGWGILTEKA
ncbi:MAG: penicillin-binding transpeptidase domain-containing protein [Candidatus Aminicenantia bacterium]